MISKFVLIGTLSLIGAYFGLRFLFNTLEEIDTAMQIRLGLIEAKKLHEERYGFRVRQEPIEVESECTIGFTQFRGRL